jgi:hypothetical protein
MKLIKTTAAVMLVGLLSGAPAAFAHERDHHGDHRDRYDRDYRGRADHHHGHWRSEHRGHRGHHRGRDWDDVGTRVVIGLPLPPLVLPPPPHVILKRLPAPPVIVLPRPY